MSESLPRECGLTHFEHDGGEITIFSEREEVLHVKSLDFILAVLGDNSIGNDQRLVLKCADPIDRETEGRRRQCAASRERRGGQRTIREGR